MSFINNYQFNVFIIVLPSSIVSICDYIFNLSSSNHKIYTCNIKIVVATSMQNECFRHKPIILDGNTGYLSSIVTEETRAGTERCPWRLEAGTGTIL